MTQASVNSMRGDESPFYTFAYSVWAVLSVYSWTRQVSNSPRRLYRRFYCQTPRHKLIGEISLHFKNITIYRTSCVKVYNSSLSLCVCVSAVKRSIKLVIVLCYLLILYILLDCITMPSNQKLISKMRQIVQWILVVHVVSFNCFAAIHYVNLRFLIQI